MSRFSLNKLWRRGRWNAGANRRGLDDPSQAEAQAALARGQLMRHKLHNDEIANWSLMNANLQHHMLAAQAMGLDPYKSVIPWGSQTHSTVHNVQNSAGLLPRAILAAVAAVGLGTAGAGVAALLGWIEPRPRPTPSQSTDCADQYEWVLDIERSFEGRAEGGGRRAESGERRR